MDIETQARLDFSLTKQELDVAILTAQGYSLKEIAEIRTLTIDTVRKRRQRMYRKIRTTLGVATFKGFQLVHLMYRLGYLEKPLFEDLRPVRLYPREIEVLKLISEGLSNDQIASKLPSIKPGTVERYRLDLYEKGRRMTGRIFFNGYLAIHLGLRLGYCELLFPEWDVRSRSNSPEQRTELN